MAFSIPQLASGTSFAVTGTSVVDRVSHGAAVLSVKGAHAESEHYPSMAVAEASGHSDCQISFCVACWPRIIDQQGGFSVRDAECGINPRGDLYASERTGAVQFTTMPGTI